MQTVTTAIDTRSTADSTAENRRNSTDSDMKAPHRVRRPAPARWSGASGGRSRGHRSLTALDGAFGDVHHLIAQRIPPGLVDRLGGFAALGPLCRRNFVVQIGRASFRERVCEYGWISVVCVSLKKKKKKK